MEQTIEQLYSEAAGKFLADRFVTGTCPKCQFEVNMLPSFFFLLAFNLLPACLYSSSYLPLLFFLLVQLGLYSFCLLFCLFLQLGSLLYCCCLPFFLSFILLSLSHWLQVPVQAEDATAFFLVVQLCCLVFFIHSLPTPLTYSVHSPSWSSS